MSKIEFSFLVSWHFLASPHLPALITLNDHEPLIAHPGSYDADRCIHRNDHGQPRGRITPAGKEAAVLAVVVTIAKGYDLGYIWKTQDHAAERTTGGYYLNAAQAGEPPGRWWGPGAQALGLTPGQTVQRNPYDAVYRQTDPRTGARLGRARGRYPTFADHLARLTGGRAARHRRTAHRTRTRGRPGHPAARRLLRRHRLVLQVHLGPARLPAGERAPRPNGRRPAGRRVLGRAGAGSSRRSCTGPTGPRWSTCRPGPGSPAPATTAPGSTAVSRAGSSPPG